MDTAHEALIKDIKALLFDSAMPTPYFIYREINDTVMSFTYPDSDRFLATVAPCMAERLIYNEDPKSAHIEKTPGVRITHYIDGRQVNSLEVVDHVSAVCALYGMLIGTIAESKAP